MSEERAISGSALITNPTGLHARPAVKLTKLAKSFEAQLRLRVGEDGKWTDAKSVARVLALKAPAGQTLFFEAEGPDASEALFTLTELVRRNFDEGSQRERQFEGQVASAGLGEGFLVVLTRPAVDGFDDTVPVNPETERTLLTGALARAARELERLKSAGGTMASEILDFQIELLRDAALLEPAFRSIEQGRPAGQAFRAALEGQIEEYRSATDEYFAARATDLADLRDRVLAALAPSPEAPALAASEDGIYVADDLTPSRFLELDWSRWKGAALLGGSPASHVAILARSRGVPLLVGVRATLGDFVDREAAVLDAETGRLILSPSESTSRWFSERQQARAQRAELEEKYRAAPAFSASGTRIIVQINVESETILDELAPSSCDGIGLTRTEFLFHGKRTLPDEESQFRFYRRLIEWAAGKPVTIRTLDAGGDKPIPGLTPRGELNPFLGVRGIRLSLAHPDVFRVQLRALARAAALGPLKVMLPMVTIPAELERARRMLQEEADALVAGGVRAAVPPLGIMVEVPAVAIGIARFDAAFYSIGTNDLIQYVTASSRDSTELSQLYDPLNPAVLELIARVAAHGRAAGREVSVCGEMASNPEIVPHLLDVGITNLSVAITSLGTVKHAVSAHAR
ncbi:MAG TPA: phosphoenolpyruvate--protein phosphotransferase [Myxococcales bacterium]|jgi:phosphoenolpyruvate-protein phosphotransferase (PTS system enzyme I)|nr:phosphoenolpyruvate--protein phosphotransferase [Myxococcales bacterium]